MEQPQRVAMAVLVRLRPFQDRLLLTQAVAVVAHKTAAPLEPAAQAVVVMAPILLPLEARQQPIPAAVVEAVDTLPRPTEMALMAVPAS